MITTSLGSDKQVLFWNPFPSLQQKTFACRLRIKLAALMIFAMQLQCPGDQQDKIC